MSAPAWRAALRIARREAWRAKGRSLLVIALIGLPVFILAGADIGYRTWQLSPTEKLAREIGAADAGIRWYGGHVQQTPSAWWDTTGSDDAGGSERPDVAQVQAHLPVGTRMIERRLAPDRIRIQTESGLKDTNIVGLDYADPIARGLLNQKAGHAPRTTGEAALTVALAKSTGLHIGDELRITGQDAPLRIVGVVADAGRRNAEAVYTLPAAAPTSFPGLTTWLVDTPGPASWAQVRALNEQGYLVLSREAYLHPPPAAQVPDIASGSSFGTEVVATGALIVGMALLEVVLLAGPAFAVGARRQRRDLALIAAVGGRRCDLRNVVLANGVVLGVAAGVCSVVGGLAVAAVGVPTLGRLVDSIPGRFDVRPLELLALALLSVVTALLAALFPARGAARADVVAALAGRRGAVRTRRHVPVIGALIVVLGVAVSLAGTTSHGTAVIMAGIVLVEIGLIVCTPALLGLLARLGRRLPLSGRIALRDAGRNRSAATPAVAAVMASVIGAVALSIGVASTNDQDRRNYNPSVPMGDAWATLNTTSNPDIPARTADIEAALRATLPAADVVTVRVPQDPAQHDHGCAPGAEHCYVTYVEIDPDTVDQAVRAQSRYRGGYLPDIIVDDGSTVAALFGSAQPAAADALRNGEVVAVDQAAVSPAGTVTVLASTWDHGAGAASNAGPVQRRATVPAVVVPDGYAPAYLIMPPSVAAQLGVAAEPTGVLVHNTRQPTEREEQAARATLAQIDSSVGLYVEKGYRNLDAWLGLAFVGAAGLLALAAAVIATALANVDSRPDLVTLGAVGASPRTRRLLSAWRAAVIAGIGTVIGVLAGFVPPTAWVHARGRAAYVVQQGGFYWLDGLAPAQLRLVVPWPALAATLIGIPLAAALVAGAFSRSRLPSERPAD